MKILFSAYVSADVANFTGDGSVATIPFDAASYNADNCFDLGSYTFTAPDPGIYLFSGGIKLSNFTTGNHDFVHWTLYNLTSNVRTTISLLAPEPYSGVYNLSLNLNGFGVHGDLSLARADQVVCEVSVGPGLSDIELNGSTTELMTFLNCYKVT